MKLILTADVDNLGAPGDTVEVKDGYGRNFLLPRGLAIAATRGAQKQVEGIRRAQQARQVRDMAHATELKLAIEGLDEVSLRVRTAGTGKLFGSVTPADVAGAIRAAGGPAVDKRAIELPPTHIKSVGTHQIAVRLHPDVVANVALSIVAGG